VTPWSGCRAARRFLRAAGFRRAPSLFHLHYSDRFLTPPTFVRMRLFRYRLTTRRQRRELGTWWMRTPAG